MPEVVMSEEAIVSEAGKHFRVESLYKAPKKFKTLAWASVIFFVITWLLSLIIHIQFMLTVSALWLLVLYIFYVVSQPKTIMFKYNLFDFPNDGFVKGDKVKVEIRVTKA
jgi:hypothetical protein